MTSRLNWINLALRGSMEIGLIVALGYWGYTLGGNPAAKILAGILAPMLGFGFWGLVDFRQAGRIAEPLRLAQELAISGFAAVACYLAGAQALGLALGVVSLIHHVLVYALGGRLLKQ